MSEPDPGDGATDYSFTYDPDLDFDNVYTRATAAAVTRWLEAGQQVLELGSATGLMTSILVQTGVTVVGVERSERYIATAASRGLRGVTFVQGDVEVYEDGRLYQHVVATNLIHELPDPGRFFARCRDRLAPGGLLHLSLQNPHSIHRLAALESGLISDLHEISARGEKYATRQLFDAEQLVSIGEATGLACVHREGVMLKPLPNDLMARLPDHVLAGFAAVARHFPVHCAMNYLVFRR